MHRGLEGAAGALRAALAVRRDSFALALEQAQPNVPYRRPGAPPILQTGLTTEERAVIEESLAGAAERLDELSVADNHLITAINLRPPQGDVQREALVRRRAALLAEQDRRAKNAARRPLVKDVIEQSRIVSSRILRGAP